MRNAAVPLLCPVTSAMVTHNWIAFERHSRAQDKEVLMTHSVVCVCVTILLLCALRVYLVREKKEMRLVFFCLFLMSWYSL